MGAVENAEIRVVYWGWDGNATLKFLAQVIDECLNRLPNTRYYDWLAQYGAEKPDFFGSSIQPWDGPTPLDKSDIRNRLGDWINAGVLLNPAQNPNQLYVVFGPPGVELTHDGETSLKDFSGYHDRITPLDSLFGYPFGMFAAIPWVNDLSPLSSSITDQAQIKAFVAAAIDRFTPQLIHEVVEAVTDPDLDGEEIGDPCERAKIRIGPWFVEKYFSNLDIGCVPSAWSGWAALGGQINGSPAAYFRQPGICDVFVWGKDNKLWQKSWVSGSGWWANWVRTTLIGDDSSLNLLSSPVAASAGPDHVQVFAYGTKNGPGDPQVYSKWWTAAEGISAWTALGGQINGSPAAYFRQPGICDVFVWGKDNKLWQKSWVQATGWWPNWRHVDPDPQNDNSFTVLLPPPDDVSSLNLTSAPVAASAAPGHVQIFAYGTKNHVGDAQIYSKWWS